MAILASDLSAFTDPGDVAPRHSDVFFGGMHPENALDP
ncbi:hypothetical protein PSAL_029430 [Pseudooceanicola algae]|uniref:Uncharacterized protein n=1 Tax=Pseudooceanicola algae TaxID=1537215 RepID=A0A418SGG7_9RHOB|nr:hypothetical protein PSAL_029430 [Pseudooceanicola algae]